MNYAKTANRYDLEEAKRLLKEAVYPNGFSIKCHSDVAHEVFERYVQSSGEELLCQFAHQVSLGEDMLGGGIWFGYPFWLVRGNPQ